MHLDTQSLYCLFLLLSEFGLGLRVYVGLQVCMYAYKCACCVGRIDDLLSAEICFFVDVVFMRFLLFVAW